MFAMLSLVYAKSTRMHSIAFADTSNHVVKVNLQSRRITCGCFKLKSVVKKYVCAQRLECIFVRIQGPACLTLAFVFSS